MNTFGLMVAAILGSIFMVAWIPDFLKSIRSTKWINLKAKITKCEVDTSDRLEGGGKQYSPWIEYEYFLDNIKYSSPKVYLGGSSYFDEADKKAHFSKYKIGTNFDVWADPEKVSNSVISYGIDMKLLVPILFGAGLLAFAIHNLI